MQRRPAPSPAQTVSETVLETGASTARADVAVPSPALVASPVQIMRRRRIHLPMTRRIGLFLLVAGLGTATS
ncbi:hypothetical protein FE89_32405, partial [Azospirillum brasilense]